MPVDIVLGALQYEVFLGEYEKKFADLNRPEE